jgi:hypothetical protein
VEGAARVDSLGWIAESRIPLSQLQYVPSGDDTFGLSIMRRIARKGERPVWPLVRRSKTGMVSQWAAVPGFTGLTAPRRVELMPYSVARYGYAPLGNGTPRDAAKTRFGADLKLGPTPNVPLDAAINPDFGQVEADPGVLNLGALEQFFAERRPFFLKGAGSSATTSTATTGIAPGSSTRAALGAARNSVAATATPRRRSSRRSSALPGSRDGSAMGSRSACSTASPTGWEAPKGARSSQ